VRVPAPAPAWLDGSEASSQHWAVLLRNTGPCFFSTAGCGLHAGGDQLYGAARSAMESATKKK